MKALLDQRDPLAQLVPPARLALLALWETLVRGVLLVNLVFPAQMVSLDLLAPPSCCHSVLVRVEAIRALSFQLRRHRQPPSCPRLGWLSKGLLDQWVSQDVPDHWEVKEVQV